MGPPVGRGRYPHRTDADVAPSADAIHPSCHTRSALAGSIMARLIVSDLDGTLLTSEHRVGAYTREVIARVQALGVSVILASGRHVEDVRVFAGHLGGAIGLISCNGAATHDPRVTLLHSSRLDPDCVRYLTRDLDAPGVHVNVYRSTDWLVERAEPALLRYHQDSGFAYRVTNLRVMDPDDVLKVFFFGSDDALNRLDARIRDRFGDRVSLTSSLPQTLEVMAAGVSKGSAITRIAETLGIPMSDVIAFGDGMNDLEMLSVAGTGILMGNADPRLKTALPHLEQIGSNAEESVARHLERLLLT
jgi:Cof subfamily protein (haloacid dehalogenase superfamily)